MGVPFLKMPIKVGWLTLSGEVTFHVKLRRFPGAEKLAPFGLLRTLKENELLSEAVTLTKATCPRVTSIQLGTYVNFGGKLSVIKIKLNLFCDQFQNNEFCFHTLGPHSQTQKCENRIHYFVFTL